MTYGWPTVAGTSADIPGLDDATFQKHAADAKENCPVSKALAGIEIRLNARLALSKRTSIL